MEKICVAVRVRRPIGQESANASFWKVDDTRISLCKPLGTPISGLSYAFDHVFDQTCTNATIYQLLIRDIIRAAVDGFNGTAFAYGQTSSGKTFTMNGSESDPGIIQQAVNDIFQNINLITDREFLIRVSYMEIYNEEINDLFAPENHKLQIHESLERGVFVAGLREEIVNNAEQVLKLIDFGEVNRHFGETNMNVRSSRSHTIFRMVIESKGKDTSFGDISNSDAIRVSVLNLVDLAGSERIAKTGADGMRLKEGKHINKSLMVLGNVINKLSDGVKQRGHIPYRDSKLTRILQPALGGNAKTSIICTVAPEEDHIEETKGTLQFASRAKRITNCVQVNEILTDAALLKRQKLEIEELRKKLQGSHAGLLEQEILKLRNDMLKYELEREKLALELEEERKSHKERDQHIKEQQMKIENLSSLVSLSEHEGDSSQSKSCGHSFAQCLSFDTFDQGRVSMKQSHVEECDDDSSLHGDTFGTPCFKANSNTFVMKRSHYSRLPDSSPIPDDFANVADEDMWYKLNKGCTTDLEAFHMTPDRRYQSLPSNDVLPEYTIEHYRQEVQSLKIELQCAIQEKNELEKTNAKQQLLNNELLAEISELQQESLSIRGIPQRMCESVANCKEIFKDILSIMQGFAADGSSLNAQLLSSTSDIGVHLFSTLETHFARAMDDDTTYTGKHSVTQQQTKVLADKLNAAITSLVSLPVSDSNDANLVNQQSVIKEEGLIFEKEANARWKELDTELEATKERCRRLERECNSNSEMLKSSEERCHNLEKECSTLKEERAALVQNLSTSAQSLALVMSQKEKIVEDLNKELQVRKDLEEEVKRFGLALAQHQRFFVNFRSEVKDKMCNLRAPLLIPGTGAHRH